MPVLPCEPSVFPEDLFQDPAVCAVGGRRWYVLYTRSRQEKSLARELRRSDVPFYLPTVSRRHRLPSRLVVTHLPLFPGYVPILASLEERTKALRTGRVVRPLEVANQEEFWGSLRQVEQLLASGLPITPEGHLVRGTKVILRNGPLAGLEGVIVRTASGRRFVVQVDFLQRGASVLVDDLDLAVCR